MSISVVLAVLFDFIFGEPKCFHPLVGFGKVVRVVEASFRRSGTHVKQMWMGAVAWGVLVLPVVAASMYIQGVLFSLDFQPLDIDAGSFLPGIDDFLPAGFTDLNIDIVGLVFEAAVVYFCIAHKSLFSHIREIYWPLENNELISARESLSRVVSRDTSSLNELGVRKAAIESALENGSDAVFAPIFWFLVAGVPGVILYRLANTLDAMWGYKNARYYYFGRFAARVDDVLNWVPARLVAISYGLVGHLRHAFWAWSHQAALCSSPNAGPVMSAGAGALSIRIGGNAVYHGKEETRPELGVGDEPVNADILRTLGLLNKTLFLWCALIVFGEIVFMSLVLSHV